MEKEKQQLQDQLNELKKGITSRMEVLQERINKMQDKPMVFEVGKWYKWIRKEFALMNYQGIDEYGKIAGFGISGDEWSESPWYNDFGDWKPATESDVKEALVKEAVKRGYKEGVVINSLSFPGTTSDSSNIIGSPVFDSKTNTLTYFGSDVFVNGIWATIVKPKPIMICGYEVVINPLAQETTIDGHVFDREFWESAKRVCEHPQGIVTLYLSTACTVSLETINKILNELK